METYDGSIEEAYVMSAEGIGSFCGGQVFDTAVPDERDLARYADGRTRPYIVVQFSMPISSTRGRAMGCGEDAQPQLLAFSVKAFGGKIADVKATGRAVQKRLIGVAPSETSTGIRFSAGISYSEPIFGSNPTRFGFFLYGRTYINL